MAMHTRVMMENARSAEGGKQICLTSSENRVMMVTMVMRIEKNSPLKNYKTF